jgi:hypothetical protein
MPTYYDSKKIIPSPIFSSAQIPQTLEDGTIVGTSFQITVKGTITADRGSPNSSGVFWTLSDYPPDENIAADGRLRSILMKMSALRKLFSVDGKTFEVQPWDGSASTKCNPRIKNILFSEGPYINKCDYTIEMESDTLIVNGVEQTGDADTYKVSKATNNWTIEILDEKLKTYRLQHSVSAVGKKFYGESGSAAKQAWENAKDYVLIKLGLGINLVRMQAPGVLDLAGSVNAYNYLRMQNVGEDSGVFAVNESWTCYDPQGGPAAIDDFQVVVKTNEQDRKQSVSIDGTITGFEVRDNSTYVLGSLRYDNAKLKWQAVEPIVFDRVQDMSGVTLNPTFISKTVSLNQNGGTIGYSYVYDNRSAPLTPNAISELVTVTNHNQADIFANLGVPFRLIGPVLQNLFTKTAKQRDLSIEIQMPASTYGAAAAAQPNTTSLVLSKKPVAGSVYIASDVETWLDASGRYTRSTSFVYE